MHLDHDEPGLQYNRVAMQFLSLINQERDLWYLDTNLSHLLPDYVVRVLGHCMSALMGLT